MNTDTREQRRQYARPHDRWQCPSADDQSCGGTGKHVDREPCLPVPSLRLQRGIFTFSCTALVLGLLFACLTGPHRNEFFAPGPLSGSHAQILVGQGSDRCASCHGAGDKTLTTWIRDAVSSGRHIPVSQSQLCMDCHDQSLVREFALHAHNVDPVALDEMTGRTPHRDSLPGARDPRNAAGQLACATCHREHHGAEFNLTALTDKQCQTCHVNYIHSFEKDHPEFTSWPFAGRSGIAFDHVSHGMKHFREQNTEFNCQQCHIDDAQGQVKQVAPFEVSCASCHQQDISGKAAASLAMFRLPMLDTEAIAEAGQAIGEWPENCSGDFDGKIPATMKLLLMSDARSAAVLEKYGPDFEFSDLDPGQPSDISDAVTLAWSIKELLFDLSINGNAEIRRRMERALEVPVETGQLAQLTLGLHDAIFDQARQQWIPGLHGEIIRRRGQGSEGQASLPRPPVFAKPLWQEPDEETLAANPLAGLFQPVGENPGPAETTRDSDSESPRIVDHPRSEIQSSGTSGQRVHNAHTAGRDDLPRGVFEGSGEVLAINPLQNLGTNSPPVIPETPPIASDPAAREATAESQYQVLKHAITKLASGETGGWFRNDNDFSIAYRVSDHLDPLVKSWTDLAMQHHRRAAVENSNLFNTLNSKLAAGQCRVCHTVDRTQGSGLTVNWRPKYRDVSVRGFTRFSHRPHDIQTSLQDCTSCHQLDPSRSGHDGFAGFDPQVSTSSFAPISKATCASCHRQGGAPAGCVDCHNYHVGSKISREP